MMLIAGVPLIYGILRYSIFQKLVVAHLVISSLPKCLLTCLNEMAEIYCLCCLNTKVKRRGNHRVLVYTLITIRQRLGFIQVSLHHFTTQPNTFQGALLIGEVYSTNHKLDHVCCLAKYLHQRCGYCTCISSTVDQEKFAFVTDK